MKNQANTELIEDYINNALPLERQQEVEQRMATDEVFRNEVELHRQMHEHFNDAGRQRLRSIVQEVMTENPLIEIPTEIGKPKRFRPIWKWLSLLVALLAVGFLIWKQTGTETMVPAPNVNPPTTAPIAAEPEPVPQEQPVSPPAEKPNSGPIAQIDPADFQRNSSMDNIVDSGLRSDGLNVTINSPAKNASFKPDKKIKTTVRFSGVIEGISPGESLEANLLIFNNKDSNNPLVTERLKLTADGTGKAAFDLNKKLDFKQGLYYFFLEDGNGEFMKGSSFLIKN